MGQLREELSSWHRGQRIAMPGLKGQLDQPNFDTSAEASPLLLPSDFRPSERIRLGLESMAERELFLRRGEACIAIQNLKSALRAIAPLEYEVKRYTRNVESKTRAGATLCEARRHKRFWADEYRSIRDAMLRLGLPNNDATFRELKDEDTYRPFTADPHEFGSGSKLPGWIWTATTGRMGVMGTVDEVYEREGSYLSPTPLQTVDGPH